MYNGCFCLPDTSECAWNVRVLESLCSSYRIQNCFSTISAKILVNGYSFRDLWWILCCKYLWITHIFAINSDISVALIVTAMCALHNYNCSDFLRDLIVKLPTFSQSLVTFLVIIFVSLPFRLSFLQFNFRQIWGLTFHQYFSTLNDDSLISNSKMLILILKRFWTLQLV